MPAIITAARRRGRMRLKRMTILVVDDDAHMVRSIQKNVVWEALGIDTVYTANSVRQAKNVLETSEVDVLLCDIEMPQESGLDLLEWVRGADMDLEALFLTSYANFDYAQRAISLNSIEYFLKPVDYQKLTEGLKRAIAKVLDNRRIRLAKVQSDHWEKRRSEIPPFFWKQVLEGRYRDDAAALYQAAEVNMLPYTQESRLIPAVVRLLDRGGVLNTDSPDVIKCSVKKIANEWFDQQNACPSVLILLADEWVLLLEKPLPAEGALETGALLREFLRLIRAQYAVELFCGFGEPLPIDELYPALAELRDMLDDSIRLDDQPLRLQDYVKQDVVYDVQRVNALKTDLDNGDLYSFSRSVQEYLEELKAFPVNAHILKMLRLDITQMVYAYLRQTRIPAHERFSGPASERYYNNAVASIEDMKAYVRHLAGSSDLTPQREASVVNQLLDYIDQNYQKEINRAELARQVYLNPDYVSRLFKKEVGQSISSYILSKRMTRAKTLLRDSAIPIHEVSAVVGYDSFAYFSKLFKKSEGMSPSEYRHKARRSRSERAPL